mgnify:CR=1 FL=1
MKIILDARWRNLINNNLFRINRPGWANLALRNSRIKDGYLALDRNENQDSILIDQIGTILRTALKVDLLHVSRYMDYYDTYQLLAEHFAVSVDNILITNGCDEAMRLTFEACLNERKSIGYKMPTYRGVVNNSADLTDFVMSDIVGCPAVWYLCSPNNPDGKVTPASEVEKLLIDYPDTMIFLDNTYADYCDESYDYLIKYENIVIGKSFSKSWGLAGARFGVMLSHSNNITQIAKIRPIMSVSSITLQLVNYLLQNYNIIQDSIERNIRGMHHVRKYFGDVVNQPHINHVEIPWAEEFATELHSKKILFGHDQPQGEFGKIRLTTMPIWQFDQIFK